MDSPPPNALIEAAADVAADGPLTAGGVIGPYMAVFFIAFFAAIIATPIMRIIAVRFGIIDWPDLKRKAHLEPIAYLGGMGLLLGWLAGVLCIHLLRPDTSVDVHVDFRIIIGALVIAATGLFDDIYGISPRVKVGGQLFAAAALTWGGVHTGFVEAAFNLVGIAINPTVAYILAALFITALVVGGCNAMNLLDGLDGLAAGIAIIAAGGFLFIATDVTIGLSNTAMAKDAGVQMAPVIIMSLALLGALLGFLPYNFNPANIFMGDAGSLLLGYLCVSNILLFSEVPPAPEAEVTRGPLFVMAALIVFGVPICDTALAIFRRKLRGQPIFSPDNQHMHHLLVRAGFSIRKSVLIMYALGLFFAVLGCTMASLNTGRFVLAVFCVVFGFVMVTAYKCGHQQVLRDRRLKATAPADRSRPAATPLDIPTEAPPTAPQPDPVPTQT